MIKVFYFYYLNIYFLMIFYNNILSTKFQLRDLKIPNWFVHNKWAKKVGIDELIANIVNRLIDYGVNWALNDNRSEIPEYDDPIILRQLKFFHKQDLEKKYSKENLYVKACYMHHLLDFFRETNVDIKDMELVFKKFLESKVIIKYIDNDDNVINFQKEVDEIFKLLRENKQEFYEDLKGMYLLNIEKDDIENKKNGIKS